MGELGRKGPFVLRLLSLGVATPLSPAFLQSQDVDANDGLGSVEATHRADLAQRFDNAGAALEEYRRQSSVKPLRPDGAPNRPLTAFTVEVATLPEALAEEARAADAGA